MKRNPLMTITSVLSVLFMTLHLADDIVRGFEAGGPANLLALPILVTWLAAALGFAGRRSGYAIVLVASLLGTYVPVLHFTSPGGVVGGRVAGSSGAFLWTWTLIALGVSALLGAVVAAHGLWAEWRGPAGSRPGVADKGRIDTGPGRS